MFNVNQIARLAHETNREWCIANGLPQEAWEDTSDATRKSICNGVLKVRENPNSTPEMMHESWLAEKKENGWKYGPIKNEDKKEHPCFVAYGMLPPAQRIKDFIFVNVVLSCLNANIMSAATT